ncbi:unnamed protein product [Alternaria alternata]
MQRDDHLPLGQIYDNEEALLKSIDEIARLALVKTTDDEPLRLRFLTPTQPDGQSTNNEYVDLKLTSAEDHRPDMVYTTVSYCWNHEQTGCKKMQVPKYRIWDASALCKAPRQIRCPRVVLHRALRFARERKCQYLWIDQECINQEDPADVKQHLQTMHRIYRESRWTAAILSRTIVADDMWRPLFRWLRGLLDSDNDTCESAAKDFVPLLDYISGDRWFTRTWTLQEKQCASILKFLIPVGTAVHIPEEVQSFAVGNDLCIDANHLSWAASFNQEESFTSWLFFRPEDRFLRATGDIGAIDNIKTRLNFINMPGFKGRGQPSSEELSSIGHFIHAMNSCNNLVIADRISIFANACNFRYRLLSNRLDRSDISYVMCLIVSVLANLFSDVKEVKERIATTWDAISSYNMLANPARILMTLFGIKESPERDDPSDKELWSLLDMESRLLGNEEHRSRQMKSASGEMMFKRSSPEGHLEELLSLNAKQDKRRFVVPRVRRQHALSRLYRRLAQVFRKSSKDRTNPAVL